MYICVLDKLDWEKYGGLDAVKAKLEGNDQQDIQATTPPNLETPPTPKHNTFQKPEARPRFSDQSRFSNSNLQRKSGYRYASPTRQPYQDSLGSRYQSPYNNYDDYNYQANSPYDWRSELANYESGSGRQQNYPSWSTNNKPKPAEPAWYEKGSGRNYDNPYNNKLFNYDYDNMNKPSYDKYPNYEQQSQPGSQSRLRPQQSEDHHYLDSDPRQAQPKPIQGREDVQTSDMAYGNQHVVVRLVAVVTCFSLISNWFLDVVAYIVIQSHREVSTASAQCGIEQYYEYLLSLSSFSFIRN